MSKGNPIVGLAYVVTSQQEMLEKAQKEKDELTEEYMELLAEKEKLENNQSMLNAESNERISHLQDELQNAKDQENYFSGEYNRVNKENLELKLKVESLEELLRQTRLSMDHIAWHAYDPERKYEKDEFGDTPMIDGLYYYHSDSKEKIHDFRTCRNIPLAGKFSVRGACVEYKDDGFIIVPQTYEGEVQPTLIAVRVNYFNIFQCKKFADFKSVIFDPDIEENYLEALADPRHADPEG